MKDSNIDIEEWEKEGLDPAVIPLVKFFNDSGLKTYMSCQGHNQTNMSMFWIQFDKSVTEEDILGFMKRKTAVTDTSIQCTDLLTFS